MRAPTAAGAIALASLAGCGPDPAAPTIDDALRAYDNGRWADAARISGQVRSGSADLAVRQQASYVEGCAALELGRRQDAKDAFVVSARSADPVVAGRSLVMQGNIAAEESRWADAEHAYSAAAERLRGRDADLARGQARDAAARAAAPPPQAPEPPPPAASARAEGTPPEAARPDDAAAEAPGDAAAAREDAHENPRDDRRDDSPLLPPARDDAPWTVSAGVFGTETAARTRATNIAKMAKAAKLPTPRVLAVSSPGKRVWVVEVGTFTDRAKAEAARKRIAVGDAQVVRSRVPQPPG